MRLRKLKIVGIAGLAASLSGMLALAQSAAVVRDELAHVSTGQGTHGQAYLFHRGGACFALTPRHVLKDDQRDETYARLILARAGRAPLSAQADRCAYFPDIDLALMRVSGVDASADCGGLFAGQGGVEQVLAARVEGSLLTATDTGSQERRTLRLASTRVNDTDHFWVSPQSKADEPASGMSGGIVAFQGRTIGFVLANNLSDNRYEDNWRVLRIDTVALRIGQLFEGRSGAVIDSAQCLSGGPARPADRSVAGGAANFASAACGASVVAFSSPPQSNAERPENLIDGDSATVWRSSGPASVDLRLCGDRARPVRTVTLRPSPACGAAAGVEAEVFVRGHPRGPWTSLGIAGQASDGSITVSSASPLNAYDIRAAVRGQPACFGGVAAE
jgi:hypothetical protein